MSDARSSAIGGLITRLEEILAEEQDQLEDLERLGGLELEHIRSGLPLIRTRNILVGYSVFVRPSAMSRAQCHGILYRTDCLYLSSGG